MNLQDVKEYVDTRASKYIVNWLLIAVVTLFGALVTHGIVIYSKLATLEANYEQFAKRQDENAQVIHEIYIMMITGKPPVGP